MHSERLDQANEELLSATRVKSDFLRICRMNSGLPSTPSTGFSEVLYDETFGPLNAKQKTYVHNILTSGKHLLLLINQILDTSKIEAGKMRAGPVHGEHKDPLEGNFPIDGESCGQKEAPDGS